MPTLTPKTDSKGKKTIEYDFGVAGIKLELPDMNTTKRILGTTATGLFDMKGNLKQNRPRIDVFDSLRGILAVMVVLHHFRCGFRPCQVFGTTADWLRDMNVCQDEEEEDELNLLTMMFGSFVNGTFCVSVFFVMSAYVLSHPLWKAPTDKWRIAVAKRYFRLMIPVAASFLLSYILGGSNAHIAAAKITNSLWLEKYHLDRPSPITGLFSQILLGVWHGTSTLNNCVWTMKMELMGSYLVFVLVQLLKGSPHKIRTRWLLALCVILVLPSPGRERQTSFEARVHYQISKPLPGGMPGEKEKLQTTDRVVALHPVKHAHILARMHDLVNANNHPELSSSDLPLSFSEEPPDAWHVYRAKLEPNVIFLDKPKRPKKHHHLDDYDEFGNFRPRHEVIPSNAAVYRELIGAADPANTLYQFGKLEMIQRDSWKNSAPWLWYVAFVAGLWMSEHQLSSTAAAGGGRFSMKNRPQKHKHLAKLVHLFPLVAYWCASYPMTSVGVSQQSHWRLLQLLAGLVGLSGGDAYIFYNIVGAICLVWYVNNHLPDDVKYVLKWRYFQFLGKLSYSLYLTHLPVLYTVTCALFVVLHPMFDDNVMVASWLAFFLSAPIMGILAYFFWKFVDEPAILLSNALGYQLLGLVYADRGYNETTVVRTTNDGSIHSNNDNHYNNDKDKEIFAKENEDDEDREATTTKTEEVELPTKISAKAEELNAATSEKESNDNNTTKLTEIENC